MGRSLERVLAAAADLEATGTHAAGYQADASDPDALRSVLKVIQNDLGRASTVWWTAARHGNVKDVLSTQPELVESAFDIGITGLLTSVQTVLDDLKATEGASVLVANGGLGEDISEADKIARLVSNDGLALEKPAKSKLVGLLAERLRECDIYVGEVMIVRAVAGTATPGPAVIQPERIAEKFWSLSQTRDTTRFRMTP